MTDPITGLNAAVEGRYRIEPELGEGGMATVRRFGGLLLVACASLGHADVAAQTIDGMLFDRVTSRPIDQAVVRLHTAEMNYVAMSLTDEEGRFVLESPVAGDFILSASALGYESTTDPRVFTLPQGSLTLLQFRIQPRPIEIAGFTIETRTQPYLVQNGFVARANQGSGRFITPEDIERIKPLGTADLLTRTPFVKKEYPLGGERIVMRARGLAGTCTPSVYLDGHPVLMYGFSLDAIAPVSELQAVEIYRSSALAPYRYGGGTGGGCGVILLWTRAR
jgi:hypothetical protein